MVKKKNTAKSSGIVKSEEKQQLLDELKQTMHDLGRLPGLVVAPVIAFVSARYDAIPAKRREKLEEIVHNLKDEGTEGLIKLKDRFIDVSNNFAEKAEEKIKEVKSKQTTTKKDAKKPVKATKATTTKSTTPKKTTKPTTTKKPTAKATKKAPTTKAKTKKSK